MRIAFRRVIRCFCVRCGVRFLCAFAQPGGIETGAAPLLDFLRQVSHGLLRDGAALAAGEGGFGSIDRSENLCAA